jgi:hypothetical protein
VRERDDPVNDDLQFEGLPAGEMRKRCGLTGENRSIFRLDPANVPEPLQPHIPLAERFGISDDLMRAAFIEKAPAADVVELRRIVQEYDALLDEWLAGPAARGPTYSTEYIAFSCMRMAADDC